MLLVSQKDAIHKAWLYRLLSAICDNKFLVSQLRFKGGTCAAMQGFLDRFSVDLDFDYIGLEKKIPELRIVLEKILNKNSILKKHQAQEEWQFLKFL